MRYKMFTQKILSLLTRLLLIFVFSATAHATLINNEDGTITQIRNDGSRLMWLKDANYAETSGSDADGKMSWAGANSWTDTLNSDNYAGYNDWRLPETLPINGTDYDYTDSYDGSTDRGYNISAPGTVYADSTASELAYMFYVELENLSYYDTSGNGPQTGWGLLNKGPFINMEPVISTIFWSATGNLNNSDLAWLFYFTTGGQGTNQKGNDHYAWAVRSAEVPEPGSLLLLGSSLTGMWAWRRKQGRNRD